VLHPRPGDGDQEHDQLEINTKGVNSLTRSVQYTTETSEFERQGISASYVGPPTRSTAGSQRMQRLQPSLSVQVGQ
jgi:hypothetical protein